MQCEGARCMQAVCACQPLIIAGDRGAGLLTMCGGGPEAATAAQPSAVASHARGEHVRGMVLPAHGLRVVLSWVEGSRLCLATAASHDPLSTPARQHSPVGLPHRWCDEESSWKSCENGIELGSDDNAPHASKAHAHDLCVTVASAWQQRPHTTP